MEVGETTPPALRVVDLWAAGKWLTTDDNTAYTPSLSHYMRLEADRVRRGDVPSCPFPGRPPAEIFQLLRADETEFAQQFWFMRWSEIVDNVSAFAYLDDDLVIMFGFWRTNHRFTDDLGTGFVTRIPPAEFASIANAAADSLDAGVTQ
ncbi:hypothetical protein GCM10010172_39300 [Paractinoplanes ferrugineus]|uniref:Uncharacterized protein n=1 Tax=Paractinoplanes ferrugineus TaxID=113564 RepID=A0A919MAL6_9ACTN|nr:hypothetical protein Afe05nite_45460 [Actinoplanes ferrugineus]